MKHLRWLPNALTISRMLLAVPVGLCAARGAWRLGLALLLVALVTDFLDGLAAKKLDAKTKLGEQLDAYADTALVLGGLLGLNAAGLVSWWVTAGVVALGLVVGGDRIFPGRITPSVPRMVIAVSSLFVYWTGIVWMYAAQAFGWRWWYVLATAAVLAGCSLLKRHRIRAWLTGADPAA